jgi:hypothetical protein
LSYRNILILLVVLAVLGWVYFLFGRSEPEEPPEPTVYVWNVDMDAIEHIVISLPRQGLSQAFIKIAEGDWRFDDPPQYSLVNPDRWSAGPPLLLSGPGASRIITEDATDEQLEAFGLDQPAMEITLTLSDGEIVKTYVGDSTIDGINYYVKAPNSRTVALVDYTWYGVLSNLVLDPPYVPVEE